MVEAKKKPQRVNATASHMSVPRIRHEWLRWVTARKYGFAGDIVWSDQEGYTKYDRQVTEIIPKPWSAVF